MQYTCSILVIVLVVSVVTSRSSTVACDVNANIIGFKCKRALE